MGLGLDKMLKSENPCQSLCEGHSKHLSRECTMNAASAARVTRCWNTKEAQMFLKVAQIVATPVYTNINVKPVL